jgi:hypothetical protein
VTYRPGDPGMLVAELDARGLLQDAELWLLRPLAEWQGLARCDPRLATLLSAYLARNCQGRHFVLAEAKPAAYDRERNTLVAEAGGDLGAMTAYLGLLDRLWRHVPYAADPAARLEALGLLGPLDEEGARCFEELVGLAQWLAKHPGKVVARSSLPGSLLRDADEAAVSTAVLARRCARAAEADLKTVAELVLDERLLRLGEHWGIARFVRRLIRSSALSVQMLLCSDYVSFRTPPEWEGVAATWGVVDELVARMGADDADPFSARRGGISAVVTDEVLEGLEFDRLIAYESLPEQSRAAWGRIYRGCAGLRAMLSVLDEDKDRVSVERLPCFPPPPGRRRSRGVESDAEQLDLETQAELFVFGVRVLRGTGDLLRAWVVAWASTCRPKESLPHLEDLVPLRGGGYAVYQERSASKTGANETCISAPAVQATGICPSWFARRPAGRLSREVYEDHAEILREACRVVRERWEAQGRRTLPSQLAYFIRHAGADRMRQALAGRHHVLTRILRHLSPVSDLAYTRLSESEFASSIATLAEQLHEVLPR